MSQTSSSRSGGLFVVGMLMIVFGGAEVVTGVTHNFFGIATAARPAATYAVGAIGAAYCAAGILVLMGGRRAAIAAIVLIGFDAIGRVLMVLTATVRPRGRVRAARKRRTITTWCSWRNLAAQQPC
jgi:hypothetical protein